MKTHPVWNESVVARDMQPVTIWDLAWKPGTRRGSNGVSPASKAPVVCFFADGSEVVVAAGTHVLVYDAVDGSVKSTLTRE